MLNPEKKVLEAMTRRIRAARGEEVSDLVFKEALVVNVFTGEIQKSDVAVCDGHIVGLGEAYHGKEELHMEGRWLVPGLIDGHIHIESSMLLPSRLAAALLPHGTTTIISDPHEIANVMGLEGVHLMMEDSESIPFDIFYMAPSCVPATHLETSGAALRASDLAPLKNEPKVLGLAEMMNFPGVITAVPEVLEKCLIFKDKVIDGHGPSLRGHDLQAYIAAGIRSDHETWDRGEGLEKIRSGMTLMIREGTSAKNMEALLTLVTGENSRRFCMVSDDLHPRDILHRGHLDFTVRKAIDLGLAPAIAVQMVTLNPAEYFGLKDRGAVAPGYRADLVVLDHLEKFQVDRVYKEGQLMAQNGALITFTDHKKRSFRSGPLNMAPLQPENLKIADQGRDARVIELIPDQIATRMIETRIKSIDNGSVVPDVDSDILKLVVVERHHRSGRIGLGFVKGFGLKQGALASSVAHDSHNVIAVGCNDPDISRAVNEVREMGGGFAVACDDEILSKVLLEVGGLMTDRSLTRLTKELEYLEAAATRLGHTVPKPFMILSFLALPVIPELKLTDMGLVDVNRFQVVPLFVE
jgi:adenine deaminase